MATIMLLSLSAVCASTSVSAAQGSSRAGAQATPDLVGSPIAAGTGPVMCNLYGTGATYVFVKGYDGALWYEQGNSATPTWISLGGQLASSPAAVSREAGYLDVFVAGTNGAVYETSFFNGAWHAWYNVGGQVAPGTGPGVSGWPGREDVFVEGTNGALYQKTWTDATGWSGWTSLGGKLTSSPTAVSRYAGNIEVFVRGTNGAVYGKEFWDPTWGEFYLLGGQLAPGTGPAVCSWGEDRLDVFVEGTNGALYQKTFTSATDWLSWASLGGKLTSSPTAEANTYNNMINMYVGVRGTNGLIYEKEYYSEDLNGPGHWNYFWYPAIQGPP